MSQDIASGMAGLFGSGRIIDGILLLVAFEAMALSVYHQRTGRGPKPADLLINLLSGVFLMLALRVALGGGAWPWIALALTGSLIGHLIDLVRRWPVAP